MTLSHDIFFVYTAVIGIRRFLNVHFAPNWCTCLVLLTLIPYSYGDRYLHGSGLFVCAVLKAAKVYLKASDVLVFEDVKKVLLTNTEVEVVSIISLSGRTEEIFSRDDISEVII